MLISAIPPTLPWLISGLSAGPFLFPTPSGVNVQPSRPVARLSDMAASPGASARFPRHASRRCVRLLSCEPLLSDVFFLLFGRKEKVASIRY